MVRFVMRGGIWKNTEDEILKVAVMKYGKNQWGRVASLLPRKSAAQCKARWLEWLDPAVKKTEWSRAEDRKLLHLAKIMPTQWRTIAPMVGRTAAQCLARYEHLLDVAQKEAGGDGDGDVLMDGVEGSGVEAAAAAAAGTTAAALEARRLRAGEIDPHPETRPARPDAVDLDEDEREMLAEVRARMANTKGKKAKRKAREKQLERARRMSLLQKRRELKAAGVVTRDRKRRKTKRNAAEVDYNEEIPFQHKVPKGFYDTTKDLKRTREMRNDPSLVHQEIAQLDGDHAKRRAAHRRRLDEQREKVHRTINLPERLALLNRLNDPPAMRRRGKLQMPEPAIRDRDLHDYAKVARGAASVAGLAEQQRQEEEAQRGVTHGLVTGATPMPSPADVLKGQRTPMTRDSVAQEAQNLLALTTAQTPLRAGEGGSSSSSGKSMLQHPSDFSGATPAAEVARTPHALKTPAMGGSGATPTPLHDSLSINRFGAVDQGREQLRKLRAGLASLPAPETEYSLVLPEVEDEMDDTAGMDAAEVEQALRHAHGWDMEDVAAKVQTERARRRAELQSRRSQAVQRGLPRPSVVNAELPVQGVADESLGEAAQLVHEEMMALLRHDHEVYPPAEEAEAAPAHEDMSVQKLLGKRARRELARRRREKKHKKRKTHGKGKALAHNEQLKRLARMQGVESFSAKRLEQASALVERERQALLREQNVDPAQLVAALEQAQADSAFLPSQRTFGRLSSASHEERVASVQQEFQMASTALASESKAAATLERKCSVLTAGLRARAENELVPKLRDLHYDLLAAEQQQACFTQLALNELGADGQPGIVQRRIAALQQEVKEQSQAELALQQRYADLVAERDALARQQAQ